jgi:hypothetical protein
MDDREPIPSDDEVVVIPDHLHEPLRAAAECRLLAACDLAFEPDKQERIAEAVTVLYALAHGKPTGAMVRELIPRAVEAEGDLVEFVERKVSLIRELTEFGESLGGGER